MFSAWFDTPERRTRDRKRVLRALWEHGLSRVSIRDIARQSRLPEKRITAALHFLEARRLVTQLERSGLWSLTMAGHGQARRR